jgi:hypothetical protein
MPLLAFNRKDTGGESIGSKTTKAADKSHRFRPRPPETLLLWRYRGRCRDYRQLGSRNRGYIAS